MEKEVKHCRVLLEKITKNRDQTVNNKQNTSKIQELEKLQNITPCYVKLEDLNKMVTEEKNNASLNNSVTPCFVRLENIKRSSRDRSNCTSENCNILPSNGAVSGTPKNGLKYKAYLLETPSEKTPGVSFEPATPRAHVEFSLELKEVINKRNILTSKTRARVFEALDEIKIKTEEESRSYKKEKALLEIVNSEITYLTQLESIINFFMKPTRERKLLRSEDFHILFGNISTIYLVNKELLEELNKGFDNVAHAFSKIAPFLKLYSVYAYELKNSIKVLQNSRLLNPQFAKFLENQESRPEVHNKLSALLITPIQRVPRYKLLLTNLLLLTRPSEEDYNNLSECLEKIEEAAEHINKVVEDQENMQRLLEFQRCLRSGEPNVVTPGRTLIREGILMRLSANNTHSEKLYVVLMSDIIAFSKMKRDEPKVNSLKCISIFPLGKCKVIELLDKGCLRIICQEEELVLYHDQFSETKKWIKKIKDAIQNHVNDRKTLRKESSSRRPVKRKDLHEYHEVGLSPGRPLKKRKTEKVIEPTITSPKFKILKRKPIHSTSEDGTANKNLACSLFTPSSTPRVSSTTKEITVENEQQDNPAASKELYVFGKPNSVSVKLGKLFGSVKRFLGFKN